MYSTLIIIQTIMNSNFILIVKFFSFLVLYAFTFINFRIFKLQYWALSDFKSICYSKQTLFQKFIIIFHVIVMFCVMLRNCVMLTESSE